MAPSLHRIGSDLVNVYLVEDDSGVTVVDAGLSGQWDEFLAELSAMGRSIDDVRCLLLTHGDTDHIGFAERLARDHGVPAYIHGDDVARARGEDKAKASWGKVRAGPLLRFLWYGARHGGLRTQYLTGVTPVSGGATLDLPGRPQVIHLPGHSPGSVAYHLPEVDAVFVGDALTTRHVLTGATGPQPAPFTDDPARAVESLLSLRGLGSRWVLPGHGPPWDGGVEAAVDQVRERAARAD